MADDRADIEKQWERALERRGVNTVRLMLYVTAGHTSDPTLRGIMPEPPDPPRSFVERWLADKETAVGRPGRAFLWPLIVLLLAGIIVLLAKYLGDLDTLPNWLP